MEHMRKIDNNDFEKFKQFFIKSNTIVDNKEYILKRYQSNSNSLLKDRIYVIMYSART